VPTGTVTFAFTDIEGSTQRWERAREAMRAAVARHDTVLREVFTLHGGHIFKTIGDAFCVAFARPEDAILAVYAVQRALEAEDFSATGGLSARIALHTGTAHEREGDYFGPVVNRVARLLAIGHGGQVLLSSAVMNLVHGALPPRLSLRDLGEHRLKDLARPEHVYQLVGPDLTADFPALRSLDALPNNLPRALTSFVGRETEIAEITALLAANRLVTLVGSGGIGKTRISLQVAANLLDGSGDGAWFVELAPLGEGAYIAPTVAQALGLVLPAEGDPVASLVRALRPMSALLVFDNCEHLIEAAAHAIGEILRGCPRIRVLASSRQGLAISGEQTYRMPSLGMAAPAASGTLSAGDAATFPAMALFAERAQAADQRFELTDANAEIVADICRRLDGIPLAIELAAPRVKILSPRQLRDRLDERFRMLTGGSRNALPRQQTLRAMIDWSFDLLDERERLLFRRLGTFVNGFPLEGAVAVGNAEDLDEFDLLDVLASLVDKSLVVTEAQGDALRYRYLESTRAYAREKLDEARERGRCVQRRLVYLRDRFTAMDEGSEKSGRRSELQSAVAIDLEDIRSAIEGALETGAAVTGAELFVATARFTLSAGNSRALRLQGESFAAALVEGDPRLLARIWHEIAFFAQWSRDVSESSLAAAKAVAFARAAGDPNVLAHALILSATIAMTHREYDEARAALDEAGRIPATSSVVRTRLLEHRGNLSLAGGDLAAARAAYEELCREHVALGNTRLSRFFKIHVAELEHACGKTDMAIATLYDVIGIFRADDRRSFVFAAINLAGYFAALDERAECRSIAREAILALAGAEPDSTNVAQAIEHLALSLALDGDTVRAAKLEGYCEESFRAAAYGRHFTEQVSYERLTALLEQRLESEALQRALTAGARLAPEAAIALALEAP
jgi:predicted ATPase/class 3 adenylate cyclase